MKVTINERVKLSQVKKEFKDKGELILTFKIGNEKVPIFKLTKECSNEFSDAKNMYRIDIVCNMNDIDVSKYINPSTGIFGFLKNKVEFLLENGYYNFDLASEMWPIINMKKHCYLDIEYDLVDFDTEVYSETFNKYKDQINSKDIENINPEEYLNIFKETLNSLGIPFKVVRQRDENNIYKNHLEFWYLNISCEVGLTRWNFENGKDSSFINHYTPYFVALELRVNAHKEMYSPNDLVLRLIYESLYRRIGYFDNNSNHWLTYFRETSYCIPEFDTDLIPNIQKVEQKVLHNLKHYRSRLLDDGYVKINIQFCGNDPVVWDVKNNTLDLEIVDIDQKSTNPILNYGLDNEKNVIGIIVTHPRLIERFSGEFVGAIDGENGKSHLQYGNIYLKETRSI